VSKRALEAMVRQTGKCLFDADGMMIRGTVVRHLVLPGLSRESESIIDELSEKYRKDDILLSLMSQYTPNGREGAPTRRITGLEYKRVCDKVIEAGFDGCFQDRGSSVSTYTPDFDLEGVLED
jgi:putative pyruvate formate lyase activating enzyme